MHLPFASRAAVVMPGQARAKFVARVDAPVIDKLASADMAWGKNIEKPDTIAMNVIAKLAIFDQNSCCD